MSARDRLRRWLCAAGIAALAAVPAAAQDIPSSQATGDSPLARAAHAAARSAQDPQVPPDPQEEPELAIVLRPARPPAFHVNGFFTFGYQAFAAKDSFDAILGTSGGSVIGGGGSLTHRSGLFAQVDVTRFSADGERAFVHDGEVFRLGIPVRLEVRPIEVTVGYKFFVNPRPRPLPPPVDQDAELEAGEDRDEDPADVDDAPEGERAGRLDPPLRLASPRPMGGLRPYVGAGVGIVNYRESSDFAAAGENTDESFTSFHVTGGLEVPLWKWFGAAAEVNYRRVADALGKGGVSQEFGEDDLGGFAFRVKVTIGR